MGLFDSLSGMINQFQSLQSNQLAGPLMSELEQHGVNGVSGLVAQFQQSGFGEHVSSWVGDGQNLPIDADSVQQVLGLPVIQNLAAKYGVDPQQVSNLLAQHLPGIVDHLTPAGQVQS